MSVVINGTTGITAAAFDGAIDAADLTGTLPALDGSALTNLPAPTTAQVATILNASGSAPIYACRAWVNFNGTGTVAIRASGNVSSITDNGTTGRYTINFATAMPNANYAVVGSCATDNVVNRTSRSVSTIGPYSTSSIGINTCSTAGQEDMQFVNVAIFG